MADSDAVRARRARRHAVDDHSLCRPGCGGRLRAAKDGDLSGLLAAVDAEFPEGSDPLVRELAMRLAQISVESRGTPAVQAIRGLGELLAVQRGAQ